MEILSTQNNGAFAPDIPSAAANAATDIGSDFEVFLQMLTAQMKYQDPLNPIDSTDYATQLATFSGVEQAVLTNDLLKSLSAEMSVGGLTDIASWVGKEARSTAPAYFDGAPIKLFPQSTTVADTTEIVVRNSAGVEVQRISFAPGTKEVNWVGALAGGAQLPSGLYSFQVVGKINGEVTSQSDVDTYSRVNEVRLEGGKTVLVLDGGAIIPSGSVTALRDQQT
jgi:flagellar basal-body rod modification protein FlgD